MHKTEVYSWRLTPALKQALEQAAKAEGYSTGKMLDLIVTEWLQNRTSSETDEEIQRRLHADAAKIFGTVPLGEGPYDNARVRQLIKEKHRSRAGRRAD